MPRKLAILILISFIVLAPATVASAFSEQRKYIGEEYDADTGLNYLNARYYSSDIGRFISQDPLLVAVPPKDFLSDPQQLNSYSYARNNPINFSDPTGEKVEIVSRPVFNIFGRAIGSHVFYSIHPDNPDQVKILGLPEGVKSFTFGGYQSDNNPSTNKLVKDIGYNDHRNSDTPFLNGEKSIISNKEIKPLQGQTDTDLINNLGRAYNDIDLTGMNYMFWGNSEGLYNGNSNNFAYTLGVKAGLKDQMDIFNPNPNLVVGSMAPGFKTMLPTTSIIKKTEKLLNNISKYVTELNLFK